MEGELKSGNGRTVIDARLSMKHETLKCADALMKRFEMSFDEALEYMINSYAEIAKDHTDIFNEQL